MGLYWTLCMIVVYQDRHVSELAHPSSNNNNNKLKLSDISNMPWALAWRRLQIDLCPVSGRTGHNNLNNDIGLLLRYYWTCNATADLSRSIRFRIHGARCTLHTAHQGSAATSPMLRFFPPISDRTNQLSSTNELCEMSLCCSGPTGF